MRKRIKKSYFIGTETPKKYLHYNGIGYFLSDSLIGACLWHEPEAIQFLKVYKNFYIKPLVLFPHLEELKKSKHEKN